MNVRRIPSAPPNSPASNTTLSRGDAWPGSAASVAVQSSWANTNAAKSTSRESSTRRSRVDRPGLNEVVQGSTSATSSRPRVIAWSSLDCLPDDPRKMRGLFTRGSRAGSREEHQGRQLLRGQPHRVEGPADQSGELVDVRLVGLVEVAPATLVAQLQQTVDATVVAADARGQPSPHRRVGVRERAEAAV